MEPLLTKDYFFKENTGLRQEEERVRGNEPVLGTTPVEIISLSGDYRKFLPTHEMQIGTYFDTDGCTNFAALNALEIVTIYKYGKEYNWSDRFNAKMSGTIPGIGNYASEPLNSIQRDGLVDENDWPWDRGRDVPHEQRYVTYYFKEVDGTVILKAKEWPTRWDFTWGWYKYARTISRDELRQALKISPIGISIPSGSREVNGVYYTDKTEYGHRVNAIYVYDDGKVEILDHYKRTRTLSANFPIGWPTYITLHKRMPFTKIVKDKNGQAMGFLLKQSNPEAFQNNCKIFGIEVIEKADGSIDWDKMIQGNFELYENS